MATTKVAVAPMKVALVPSAGADFQVVEREVPRPGAGEVRIKVQACGVCHSDVLTKEGGWPGMQYPRAPGLKWRASSTNWGREFPGGSKGSASAGAGTAVTTGRGARGVRELFATAAIRSFRASART